MYDSTNLDDIPADAQMVASYVDGSPIATPEQWARFPSAVKVRIAALPSTNDGQVLDVETGDATPDQAPGWVQMRRAAGQDPSVYCNESTWPSVRAAFQAAGVAEPHYWIAAWNGDPSLLDGAVAHQYAGSAMTGAHYDLSAVADSWPGVDTIGPPVPPGPGATEVVPAQPVSMIVFDSPTNDRSFVDYDSVQYVPGQVAQVGQGNTWSRAKLAADPAGRWASKWLLAWDGSTWAVWADAATSNGQPAGTPTDPTQFEAPIPPAPAPPPPAPPPAPPPVANLDDLRAAWAQMVTLFTQAVPAAVAAVQKALDDLKNLP